MQISIKHTPVVFSTLLAMATHAFAQNAASDPKLHAMLPEEIREAGVIVGAASLAVPPLLYSEDASNTPAGAVAEITKAYAKKLGVEIRIEKVSGGGPIPGVLARRYDIVASVGDFKSRQGVLDFVDMVKGGTALLVMKGNPTDVKGIPDLCGRKLATAKGSIQESQVDEVNKACEADGKPEVNMMSYPDSTAAILAMQSGRAEVFWDDLASASYRTKEADSEFEIAGDPQDLAPYAVGIPKDRPELRDAIQAALQSVMDDGTYMAILEKWGLTAIAESEIVINGSEF